MNVSKICLFHDVLNDEDDDLISGSDSLWCIYSNVHEPKA